MSDIDKIFEKAQEHISKLHSIVDGTGELMEGNIYFKHLSEDYEVYPSSYVKRSNIVKCAQRSTNILEIGFNAGHSSLLILLANPDCKLTCFDIATHKYTIPCFEYLQNTFGSSRVSLHVGPSNSTVPAYKKANPDDKFDMVHIDGSHIYTISNLDFWITRGMSDDGGIVIFDDLNIPHLKNLWEGYISSNAVREDSSFTDKTIYQGIGRFLY